MSVSSCPNSSYFESLKFISLDADINSFHGAEHNRLEQNKRE